MRLSRHGASCLCGTLLFVIVLTLLCAPISQAAEPATIVTHGSSYRKWIALTFDDNTSSSPTLATLRVLRDYQAPATLFVVGSTIDVFPEVTNEIAAGVGAGLFEVGDHSFSHPDLATLSAEDLTFQIGGGTETFTQATGTHVTTLFRPPYGHFNPLVAQIAGDKGFSHLVLWDVGTEDWTGEPARAIENNIVSRAHSGAIVLLHMAATHTAEALPGIITRLRQAGYELVLVSDMLKDNHLFLDVRPDTEVGVAVATIASSGYMSGYSRDYFGPGDRLTRQQAAKVVTLVTGIHTESIDRPDTRTFWDVPPTFDANGDIEPYPYDFVEEAVASGLVRGTVDTEGRQVFRPDVSITRVQLAQILARMAREFLGYPDELDGEAVSFPDVADYATADVALVARLGLMRGYKSGRFGADDPAQRGQVAVVMNRYLQLPAF